MQEKTDRVFVANLIKNVLAGNVSVLDVLKLFPKRMDDKSLETAFHALMHREADEDIRAKSSLYGREQDEYLLYIAETLEKDEPLPQNIIDRYTKYYKNAPIYPKMNRKNIIERLKKFINI